VTELLPSAQAREVRQGLLDYLTTTFALADSDARTALADFLTDATDGIFKGPYLRLRLPFRSAADGWQRALDWDPGFTPYGHQAAAFARLSSKDLGPGKPRPLPTIVTTGTGSGKTEAFLVPILDHVLRERRAGRAGMKALILYPMNALANDQAARLARMITENEVLKGVTAGLYTGQQVQTRTRVTADGLITDRGILRDDPPDLLLTNYKMLDQLLLRAADQPLWTRSATSLRYLVLDEFHTYDGAQGTDVAMLLRRLGLALKSHWGPDDPAISDLDRARPLGLITPVATSATLGDRGDPAAMVAFAHTVFGDEIDETCVVTESRIDAEEWRGDAPARVEAVEQGLRARYPSDSGDPDEPVLRPATLALSGLDAVNTAIEAVTAGPDGPRALAVQVLAALYDTTGELIEEAERLGASLLDLAKAHPLVQDLVERCGQAVHTDDLAEALFPADGLDPRAAEAARVFLLYLAAALSHVRATVGRDAATVDLHLWVRELTRIDRVAASTAKYLWGDDGALMVAESHDPFGWEGRPAFPAVYCRHCGRSGWGVGLAPTGTDLDADDTAIRRNHAAREGRFRALLYAPLEADHAVLGEGRPEVEGLRWFSVKQRAVLVTPPADDDPDFRDGWVLPVLSLVGPDADAASKDDTCPSCLRKDGIRFLGSAIATQLSVALSTLFGHPTLDAGEKKALVFTDSVQDAAHRAGFVQSRSHTLTLRSVLLDAIGPEPIGLDELVDEVIRAAGDDGFRRYRLIPPSLTERAEFEAFWTARSLRAVPAAVRKRARARLLFDVVMEFGLFSRVGRTLEATGSVVAEVSATAGLAALGRAVLAASETQALDEALGQVPDAWVAAWVRGILEHLRERGAIEHPWFAPYIAEDGSRYRIWGGRPKNQGMPAFPKGRSVPAFPRIGPAQTGQDPLLDSVTSAQSWYARWAARTLSVSVQHGARLSRALLERLAREQALQSFATSSGASVYAVPHAGVLVSRPALADLQTRHCLLECTVCRTRYPGTPGVVDQLDGAPCLLVRCPGRLRRAAAGDNYYRRLYASADPRRVVAREHSSLLEDATRVAYETAFKSGQGDPRSPNVLVATPTLEMGIDIGDLSAVMLASLPRSVASYLQRVGRAGRLTGNALNLAFVTGRGEHLPRLGDPLSVINGQVRPPATYLDAEEILQRQYVAHLVDTLARTSTRPAPRWGVHVLAGTDPGTFLGELITLAETDAATHLDRFLAAFDGLAATTRNELRAWVTPTGGPGSSALARHLAAASARWAATLEELRHRKSEIEAALPELKKIAELPAATDDDTSAHRSARAARRLAAHQAGDLQRQPWVQALEEHGVLPNYTLIDDAVTLDVAVTWIDPDTQEYRAEGVGYRRSAANALREFAPGAVFYAQGLEIDIDSVDLGYQSSAVRPWAFCPDCGYAIDRGTGATLTAVPSCPRCGGKGIADTKQHLEAIELTRVSAELRRDEAAITDRNDERRRERFAIFVAADVDPAAVVRQWYVDGYDFGVKYLRRMDIRWINAGRAAGYGATTTIGGVQRPANLFRVCAGCGKLDRSARTNRPDEHRPWCRYRKAAQEQARTVALMRSLRTQAVVLPLPTSVTLGDLFAVPSLAAALLLGLREQLGGSPDHLAVAHINDPTYEPGGGLLRPALLVHDTVPGGTGYLAELADPQRLWDLLYRAWVVVRDCPCQHEARLACHRCLLPFAGRGLPVTQISRQAAERHLRAILTSGRPDTDVPDTGVAAWDVTDVPPPIETTESHLEQHFRRAFRDRVAALGATVQEVPGPKGNLLRIGFPGATRHWTLEPQVTLHGCRPDFLLRCNDPNIPDVAVFTDGRQFHATPARNRLADDAVKRAILREQGLVVLGVTAHDVEAAAAPAATLTVPAPSWWNDAVVAAVLEAGQFPLTTRTVEAAKGGPFAFLLAWLQKPDPDDQATFAAITPMFFTPGAVPTGLDPGGLAPTAARLLTIDPTDATPVGGQPAAQWWRHGPLGVLTVARQQNGVLHTDIAVVLDDRDSALTEPGHADAWREWLRISNALNLRETSHTIATLSQLTAAPATAAAGAAVAAGTGAAEVTRAGGLPLPRPGAGGAAVVDVYPELPADWAVQLELAEGPEEAAFLVELATTTSVPTPRVGYESAEGIIIPAAWPDHRVAVYLDADPDDRRDLEAVGWHVLSADVSAVAAALTGPPPIGPQTPIGPQSPAPGRADAHPGDAAVNPSHAEEGR
jgi:ATP-dependent helicase YprA (DUF1998 family)